MIGLFSMAKQPDIQVLIPYKDLCELLNASEEVKKLRKEVKRLTNQQDSLRSQFIELMDAFGELRDYVTD